MDTVNNLEKQNTTPTPLYPSLSPDSHDNLLDGVSKKQNSFKEKFEPKTLLEANSECALSCAITSPKLQPLGQMSFSIKNSPSHLESSASTTLCNKENSDSSLLCLESFNNSDSKKGLDKKKLGDEHLEKETMVRGTFHRKLSTQPSSPKHVISNITRPGVSFAKQMEIVTYTSFLESEREETKNSSMSPNTKIQKISLSPVIDNKPISSNSLDIFENRPSLRNSQCEAFMLSRTSYGSLENLFLPTKIPSINFQNGSSHEALMSNDRRSVTDDESPYVFPSIDDIAKRSCQTSNPNKRLSTVSTFQSPGPMYCFNNRLSLTSDMGNSVSPVRSAMKSKNEIFSRSPIRGSVNAKEYSSENHSVHVASPRGRDHLESQKLLDDHAVLNKYQSRQSQSRERSPLAIFGQDQAASPLSFRDTGNDYKKFEREKLDKAQEYFGEGVIREIKHRNSSTTLQQGFDAVPSPTLEFSDASHEDSENYHSPLATVLRSDNSVLPFGAAKQDSSSVISSSQIPQVSPTGHITIPRLSLSSLQNHYSPLPPHPEVSLIKNIAESGDSHALESNAKRFSLNRAVEKHQLFVKHRLDKSKPPSPLGCTNRTTVLNSSSLIDINQSTKANQPDETLYCNSKLPHARQTSLDTGKKKSSFGMSSPTPRATRRTVGPIKVSQGGIWERLEDGTSRMTPRPQELVPATIKLSSIAAILSESPKSTLVSNVKKDLVETSIHNDVVPRQMPLVVEEETLYPGSSSSIFKAEREMRPSCLSANSTERLPPISLDRLETPYRYFNEDPGWDEGKHSVSEMHQFDDSRYRDEASFYYGFLSQNSNENPHSNHNIKKPSLARLSVLNMRSQFSNNSRSSGNQSPVKTQNAVAAYIPLVDSKSYSRQTTKTHPNEQNISQFVSPRFGASETTHSMSHISIDTSSKKLTAATHQPLMTLSKARGSTCSVAGAWRSPSSSQNIFKLNEANKNEFQINTLKSVLNQKDQVPLNQNMHSAFSKPLRENSGTASDERDENLIFKHCIDEPCNRSMEIDTSSSHTSSLASFGNNRCVSQPFKANKIFALDRNKKEQLSLDSLRQISHAGELNLRASELVQRSTLLPHQAYRNSATKNSLTYHSGNESDQSPKSNKKSGEQFQRTAEDKGTRTSFNQPRQMRKLPEIGVDWNICHTLHRISLNSKYFSPPFPTLKTLYAEALLMFKDSSLNEFCSTPLNCKTFNRPSRTGSDEIIKEGAKKENRSPKDASQGIGSKFQQRHTVYPEENFTPERVAEVIEWLDRRNQSESDVTPISSLPLILVLDHSRHDTEVCDVIVKSGIKHLLSIFERKASTESWDEVLGLLTSFWPQRFHQVEHHIKEFPSTPLARYYHVLLHLKSSNSILFQQYTYFTEHIVDRQDLAAVLALAQWKLNVSLPAHYGALERLQATAVDLHRAVEHAESVFKMLQTMESDIKPIEGDSGIRVAQQTLQEQLQEAIGLEKKQVERLLKQYEERKLYCDELETLCVQTENELKYLQQKIKLLKQYVDRGQAAIQLTVLQSDVLEFQQYEAGFRLHDIELDYIEMEILPERYRDTSLLKLWKDYLARWVTHEDTLSNHSTWSKNDAEHVFETWVSDRQRLLAYLEEKEIEQDIQYAHQAENILLQNLALIPTPHIQIWWRYDTPLQNSSATESGLVEGLKVRVRSGLAENVREYIPESLYKAFETEKEDSVMLIKQRFELEPLPTPIPLGLGPVYYDWSIRQRLYQFVEERLSCRLEHDLHAKGFPRPSAVEKFLKEPSTNTESIPFNFFLPGVGMDKVVALASLTVLHCRQIEQLMSQHRVLYSRYPPLGFSGPESTYIAAKTPIVDIRFAPSQKTLSNHHSVLSFDEDHILITCVLSPRTFKVFPAVPQLNAITIVLCCTVSICLTFGSFIHGIRQSSSGVFAQSQYTSKAAMDSFLASLNETLSVSLKRLSAQGRVHTKDDLADLILAVEQAAKFVL